MEAHEMVPLIREAADTLDILMERGGVRGPLIDELHGIAAILAKSEVISRDDLAEIVQKIQRNTRMMRGMGSAKR